MKVLLGAPLIALLVFFAVDRGSRPADVLAAAVGAELRRDRCAGPAATLFVWGPEASFYYYSEMAPASRFVWPHETLSGFVSGNWGVQRGQVDARHLIREDHWDLLMEDLHRRSPAYVLDLSEAVAHWRPFALERFPRLRAFVAAHYEQIVMAQGVRAYRRIGCSGPRLGSGGARQMHGTLRL